MADTTPLDAEQLAAYFVLMEVSSLLQHAVEQQLRADGGLSYVQFQILARLSDSPDEQQRMTDLADQIVYSRAGLTYQAGQLEKAALITRSPSIDDERSTTVTITATGRTLLRRVLPGHIDLVRQMLLPPLSHHDMAALTRILGRVRDRMRAAPPRSAASRQRRARDHATHNVQ
jgi:DNA-binding MarR family transcriptional regulator